MRQVRMDTSHVHGSHTHTIHTQTHDTRQLKKKGDRNRSALVALFVCLRNKT